MTQENKRKRRKLKIKPIISESYSLTDYLANYNVFDIYLAYVKTRGYILINSTGFNYWFKSYELDVTPEELNNNGDNNLKGKDKENYDKLLNEIANYLKPYEKEFPHQAKDQAENIFYDLILDLAIKEESDSYIKISDYNNKQMKQFIINPLETFNKYIEANEENFQLSQEEAYETKIKLDEKIKDLTKWFISKQACYVPRTLNDGSILKEPIFKPKDLYEAVINIADNIFPSNIFNLKTGGKKLDKTQAVFELASLFNIKKTLKDNNEAVYYYNESNNYYEEITEKGLKNLIYKAYGFNLIESDIKAIYKSIPFEDKLYKNILVFNNCLFDADTLEKLEGIYNRRDYLTLNRIGYKEKGNNKINLLDFDNAEEPLEVDDILTVKENPEDAETLVEKTLRQILIPKNNPKDLSLFQDYLERTGAKIFGRNLFKELTFYETLYSNAGKTIILYLHDLLYNDKNISIDASTLEDNFSFKSYDNALAINIDEIDKDSFEKVKPILKRITSQYSKQQFRNMREETQYIIEEFAEITICSNIKLEIDPNEDYALFERIDFLKLPNRFVNEKDVAKFPNAYAKNDKLFEQLKADKKGLNWLITASIKCLKNMLDNNKRFCCKQTAEESIDIYLDGDIIKKFLVIFTKKDLDLHKKDYVHAKDIKAELLKYTDIKGISFSQHEYNNLSQSIGYKLANLYNFTKGNGRETDSKGTKYAIKLKSVEEVAIEFKQVYMITEEITDKELTLLERLSSDEKTVYDAIQNGKYNTINLLKEKYVDLDVIEIVKDLVEANLIHNTFSTNLNEF